MKAGDEFGRNSAQAICFIGISQIQQALLPILPMIGEEIGQTLILFEKFHSDEIQMLSELDPGMLFEDIRTGLAQHWRPSEKWWKTDKEQKALLELMNSITQKGENFYHINVGDNFPTSVNNIYVTVLKQTNPMLGFLTHIQLRWTHSKA